MEYEWFVKGFHPNIPHLHKYMLARTIFGTTWLNHNGYIIFVRYAQVHE